MVVLILIFAALSLLFLCNKYAFFRTTGKRQRSPPEPWGIPMIGFLIHFAGGTNYAKKLIQLKENYGNIVAVRMGSFKCVWLNEPKLIREAWANPVFCGRPRLHGTTGRMHGYTGGIIFNEGRDFAEQRGFAVKTLRSLGMGRMSMENYILDEIVVLIKSLEEDQGSVISTRHCFNIASLNALWRITTGERFDHDDKRMNQLAETLNRNMELNDGAKAAFFMPWLAKFFPEVSGWNTYLKDANEIFDFWKEYANSRIVKFEDNSDHSNFIHAYIQAIRDCTDESSSFYGHNGELSLAATLQDLFIAGMETTATTLSWACLFMAVFQDAQNKLFSEILQVIGCSRLPTLGDRSKMPYAEAVLQEILRFGTLAPLGFIHRTTEDIEFHGYLIPINTIVQANICAVHCDKGYWGDPETFRPERFLSEDGKTLLRHDAFLPFSSGRRLCLGESLARDELFLFVTAIIQRFTVVPDPTSTNPTLEPKIGVSAIPREHKLVFKERN